MIFHENLPELERDTAGVRRRSYKNSVYKITQDKEVGNADYWLLNLFDTENDQELFQRKHYKDMIYSAFKLAPVCPLIER